ncbi:SPOR domain-containing protein [Litorivicinus sp.]|jgi:cell division protein FtsN|nr:SPOR domain-containing protein [Litorivicinus sp.]
MKDYSTQASKHRNSSARRPNAAVAIVLSMITVGAFVAALVWLDQNDQSQPLEIPTAAPDSLPRSASELTDSKIQSPNIAIHDLPQAPQKFYTFPGLLKEDELITDTQAGEAQDKSIGKELTSKLVQTGSFKSLEAAENTRIALLFLDLKARVIPPSKSNGGWYRVVIGPFQAVRDMRATIDVLVKNGHNAQQVSE